MTRLDQLRPPLPARDRVALVLQGGGALGAYQAGIYQALHEAGLEPEWLSGVSIGAINAAIIAGNPPEQRVEKLREFWETITRGAIWPELAPGDSLRRLRNLASAITTFSLGQPGMFVPRLGLPWTSAPGTPEATSFYDTEPLRRTLARLIDFDRLNGGAVRLAVGAVNVASANFAYFDTTRGPLRLEHVMASAALPPALPMVQVGQDWFWDGGLVSNTPLQHLLEHASSQDLLVFQVDLFGARGPVPQDMTEVLAREKDIRFSSRTRLVTDYYQRLHRQKVVIRDLLAKLPDAALSAAERAMKQDLATLPTITILQIIYQQMAYEGEAKDYEFSAVSMHEHWQAGYRTTQHSLQHREWLERPSVEDGIVVYDAQRNAG